MNWLRKFFGIPEPGDEGMTFSDRKPIGYEVRRDRAGRYYAVEVYVYEDGGMEFTGIQPITGKLQNRHQCEGAARVVIDRKRKLWEIGQEFKPYRNYVEGDQS